MKIGYCYMVCDLFHIGHLEYLQKAKRLCDELIVGVLTDDATMEKKPQPIVSYDERFRIVKNIKCVDKVVMQDTYTPLHNVKKLKPDILFESTSHTKEAIEEAREVMKGGRVEIIPYHQGQSSTLIKCKIINEYAQQKTIST